MTGRPGPTINQFGRSIGAVAIVMASHGRTGLARIVLGSVAQEVVRHASQPVLVIRPAALSEAQRQSEEIAEQPWHQLRAGVGAG
jgi:hypothetical protein